uniref:Uncharacterized protein n=1 Tax=Oryza sativa subsp. indica TaxID=39946 RepID=Q0P164_ORYSI|nr:hypothetical protein TQR14A11.1 [Oryza sativa Indica Group]AAZ06245.1 hypothetical protein TQR14A11.1 [Oryza sativa Indica Group]
MANHANNHHGALPDTHNLFAALASCLDRRDADLPNLVDKVHKLKIWYDNACLHQCSSTDDDAIGRVFSLYLPPVGVLAYNAARLMTTIRVDCWITEQHQVDLIGTNVVARRAAPEPGDCVAPGGGAGEAERLLVFVAGAGIHELLQHASSYSSKLFHGDGSHLFFLLQITRNMQFN